MSDRKHSITHRLRQVTGLVGLSNLCAEAADALEAAEAKLAAIDARLHRSSYNLGRDIRLILHPEEK